ncbi:MAG: hypothetical protein U9Q29_03350 [Campylobacterota bacterium]|nr:hypothetical protein [Campylobacterota bacterium]
MFNKFAKVIRWTILVGMLYSLYVVILKDEVEFKNETDEKVLVEMAKTATKSRDEFMINRRLTELFPQKKEHQVSYLASVRKQANKLLDAHEKLLYPLPSGNYRYVKNIRFGQKKDGEFVLIFNLTKVFKEQLDENTQKTLKDIFYISHHGIYTHFGFEKGMPLLLVPTYDNLENITIMDLNRTTVELPELGADITPDKLPQK